MVDPQQNNNQNNNNYSQTDRRTPPLLQGDSELIYSFSQPDAMQNRESYFHINKDYRMANLESEDMEYLNLSSVAGSMGSSFLGENAKCVVNIRHDQFVVLNLSVSKKGFAMKTLVTRKSEQNANITKQTKGVFSSNKNDNDDYM